MLSKPVNDCDKFCHPMHFSGSLFRLSVHSQASHPVFRSFPLPRRVVLGLGLLLILILLSMPAAAVADEPEIRSGSALVIDHHGHRLVNKNATEIRPIASITKLMTAMVVLDAGVPLDERILITDDDRDRLRWSKSRLRVGEARLSREALLRITLMSSDNFAAAALGRTTFPGGTPAFVDAMNAKAEALNMRDSTFADASGLSSDNVATAEDLVRLVDAAAGYALILDASSASEIVVDPHGDGWPLTYRNTNPLVRNADWEVELSKTGYLNEAGRCLVMQAVVADRRVYLVLLDADGKYTPVGDSNRLRKWLERQRVGQTAGLAGDRG